MQYLLTEEEYKEFKKNEKNSDFFKRVTFILTYIRFNKKSLPPKITSEEEVKEIYTMFHQFTDGLCNEDFEEHLSYWENKLGVFQMSE